MTRRSVPVPPWKQSGAYNAEPAPNPAAWDRWYTETDSSWAPANIWVQAELNGVAPGRALDLGAGDARHAVWLAGRGWHVQAVDFSDEALRIGRERAFADGVSERITWTVADVTVHSPDPVTFDLILVAYLHLPAADIEAIIARAAAGLAAGGRFLLISHDPANPREGTGGPQDPSVLHGPAQVSRWLRQAGLHIESSDQRSRPVPGARRPALDCLVLARSRGCAGSAATLIPPAACTDRTYPPTIRPTTPGGQPWKAI